jgi:7-keto-8-aminopelargonate synthetase-like enzyme
MGYWMHLHLLSAALSPGVLEAVNAGIDLIEREPQRRSRLFDNVARVASGLRARGLEAAGATPIVALMAPPNMDMHRGCALFDKLGIFLSAIEFPVVPRNAQRYRISLMMNHTEADIDRLLNAIDEVWEDHNKRSPSSVRTDVSA